MERNVELCGGPLDGTIVDIDEALPQIVFPIMSPPEAVFGQHTDEMYPTAGHQYAKYDRGYNGRYIYHGG
jgi:hypothetical protein